MKNWFNALGVVSCALAMGLAATQASAADDTTSAAGDTMSGIHAGDVLVRLRSITIVPQTSTNNTLSTLNVGVNNATVPELDFTYMIRDNIGVIDDVPQNDPRRVEFNELHRWSTRLEVGVLAMGIAVLYLTTKAISS